MGQHLTTINTRIMIYAYGNQVSDQLASLNINSKIVEIISTLDYPNLPNRGFLIESIDPIGEKIGHYSFDVEKLNKNDEDYVASLGVVAKTIKTILVKSPGNVVTVYINPKECVNPKYEENGVTAAHNRIIDILGRFGARGCVLIPAYTLVERKRATDKKEHGVNINDSISLARKLKAAKVNYKFILGVHNYLGNKDLFKETLRKLEKANVVGPEEKFAYFGLNATGYNLTRDLLDDVESVFNHL